MNESEALMDEVLRLRTLLREGAELVDSMATWFRNQPMGCPPAGTAQWQASVRKALGADGVAEVDGETSPATPASC